MPFSQECECASRIVMPRDLNSYGTLFGGKLLSWMDELAVIFAIKLTDKECVTVRFDNVEFKKNVVVNDILNLKASVIHVGLCHLIIQIQAYKNNFRAKDDELVACGTVKFVALDENKKPARISKMGACKAHTK